MSNPSFSYENMTLNQTINLKNASQDKFNSLQNYETRNED